MTLAAFLDHLQRGGHAGYYWTVDASKHKRSHWWNGTGRPDAPQLRADLYFGVHPTLEIPTTNAKGQPCDPQFARSRNDLIAAVNCLFSEFDAKDYGGDLARTLTVVEALVPRPSVVVASGGGYHCYWLLDEPWLLSDAAERQRAKDVLYAWVDYTGGDTAAKDLARVLRLPGGLNHKYTPPRPVAFVWCDLELLYSRDTLIRYAEQAWARGKLDLAVEKVHGAPDGQKHNELLKAARLAGGVAHVLGEAVIERELYDAIETRAADPRAAAKTIQDGIRYGEDAPLQLSSDPRRTAPTTDPDDPRPVVDRTTIDLPALGAQAWDAVITANDPPTLFRRAGELVRLETNDSGARVVKTVDAPRMMGILARAARWVRISHTRQGAITTDTAPPAQVVDDCLVNLDVRLPILTRVVHAPTFASGDLLLSEPGYHAAARVYYDPASNTAVPTVPAVPTADDLATARGLVDELLHDFPFVSEADRAHAVALFLLPFVRELVSGPTPLHLIEAPTMGSGKGLLAEVLLMVALGQTPPAMPEATDDDEWRKRLTSTLMAAPAAIYIDNITRKLDSGALALALTAREFTDRVLGSSSRIDLPVRCVWVATGNNPMMSTEIARRCIRIRIDPRTDEPWKRAAFKHPNLRQWVEEHRGRLIWAALVLTRYGLTHGRPGRALGSYEPWSNVLSRILNGCGIPGFLGNLDVLYARADAEGAAWRALLGAWWQEHKDAAQLASALFPLVDPAGAEDLVYGKDEAGRKKSFGKALAKVQDRVFTVETEAGPRRLQIADGGTRQKTRLWRLVALEDGGIVGFGGFSPPIAQDNNTSRVPSEENPQNPYNPSAVTADSGAAEWDHVRALLLGGDDVALMLYCSRVLGRPLDDVKAEARRRWPELAPPAAAAE